VSDHLTPINDVCPASGLPAEPEITAHYRGCVVGFCSEEHRELFSRSVEYFDRLIDELRSSGQRR
jgi:hypothetical protein